MKLPKPKGTERTLSSSSRRENARLTFQGSLVRLTADFSAATVEVGGPWEVAPTWSLLCSERTLVVEWRIRCGGQTRGQERAGSWDDGGQDQMDSSQDGEGWTDVGEAEEAEPG